VVEKKQELAGPPRTFWEDDLELGMENILTLAHAAGFMEDWIAHRTGRQLNVLFDCLGLVANQSARRKKQVLRPDDAGLQPFVLVEQFAKFKSKVAVADLAQERLPQGVLDVCRIGAEDFDKVALLFAMYHRRWQDLRLVFHLDKVDKTGFARMALKQKVRQPTTSFEDFLQPEKASEVIEAFDQTKRDHRPSQLKNIVRHSHHHLAFIRRPERPQHIIRDGNIQHGHRAEWIILDFADNARRVNISSDSVEVPLEIANALASAYFGREVEYDNECQITYTKQIERLLEQLKAGTCEGLGLVDLEVRNSPLHGVDLRLCHDDEAVMRRAIAAIERDHGSLSAEVERIEKVKVVYSGKRIDIRFEKQETGRDEFIVRYFDHRLNASARKRFEDFMRDTHGIPILSTEKRFKHRD
jgi:hypothetical protein